VSWLACCIPAQPLPSHSPVPPRRSTSGAATCASRPPACNGTTPGLFRTPRPTAVRWWILAPVLRMFQYSHARVVPRRGRRREAITVDYLHMQRSDLTSRESCSESYNVPSACTIPRSRHLQPNTPAYGLRRLLWAPYLHQVQPVTPPRLLDNVPPLPLMMECDPDDYHYWVRSSKAQAIIGRMHHAAQPRSGSGL
jgi:hypothetical protein